MTSSTEKPLISCARSLAPSFPPGSPPAPKKMMMIKKRIPDNHSPQNKSTPSVVGNERAFSFRPSAAQACIHHPSVDDRDALLCFVCLFVVRQEAPTPTEATRTEQSAGERRREAGRRAGGRLLAASQPGGEVGLRLTAGAGRTNRQTDKADKPSGGRGLRSTCSPRHAQSGPTPTNPPPSPSLPPIHPTHPRLLLAPPHGVGCE